MNIFCCFLCLIASYITKTCTTLYKGFWYTWCNLLEMCFGSFFWYQEHGKFVESQCLIFFPMQCHWGIRHIQCLNNFTPSSQHTFSLVQQVETCVSAALMTYGLMRNGSKVAYALIQFLCWFKVCMERFTAWWDPCYKMPIHIVMWDFWFLVCICCCLCVCIVNGCK